MAQYWQIDIDSQRVKIEYSLRQQPYHRQGWLDTGWILYTYSLFSLIVHLLDNQLLRPHIVMLLFTDYGNGLGFKQTYSSKHGL